MCLAHNKLVNDWFTTNDTLELFIALSNDFELEPKYGFSRISSFSILSVFQITDLCQLQIPQIRGI